ncbi:long-chain fatty acid--CoA ligase [Geodermatophilus sp. DF01-2]|uniref:class I adenylate-forming enzyme family protein n=1 Tax=Geodermatophilus sp. DF01-2 TaxID=2559610 RepID=UPI00107397E7|nr:class I adenylate-forming enzyme family protein [Geodermatophilus sp. DF01_2]TFV63986.1 long-chain fatty acid--CoA ligase [Geodermatophilus sp. DF01_2]
MSQPSLRPTMTLGEAFDAAVAAAGNAWLADDGGQVTLHRLAERAEAFAAALRGAGIGPGDRVGLLLPNGIGYVEAFFGTVLLGGVAVPLDDRLTDRELAEADAAIDLGATVAERARPGRTGRLDVLTGGGNWLVPGGPAPVHAPAAVRRRDDPAAVFFTSGTTGAPKPVTLTHHGLVRPLLALQRLHAAFFAGSPVTRVKRVATVASRHGSKLLRAAGRQTWLTASPFRSMAGHQVLTGSLLLGHNLVTTAAFTPRRVLELVDRHRVNVLAGTPAMAELLLRVEDLSPYDLSSLLVLGLGGGPASPDLVTRARDRFSCAVTVGYGSTELGGGVLATRLEDSLRTQAETVGRPFPGTAVRVVDEHGAELPAGTPGELLCRPPDAPEDAPWLRTRDLAVADGDGNIRILGRVDDLVVRGGQNIHPAEVERVVAEVPAVQRCAVVGVPVHGDQQVWVFAVPVDGRELTADDIRRHCRAGLAPARRPDRVRIVPELPVNEYGEVRRHLLREQAVAEMSGRGTREGIEG